MKSSRTPFGRWLKSRGLSLDVFCRETGILYSTAVRWRHGYVSAMRSATKTLVARVYPDCPLCRG